jgi:hypothetical protein
VPLRKWSEIQEVLRRARYRPASLNSPAQSSRDRMEFDTDKIDQAVLALLALDARE